MSRAAVMSTFESPLNKAHRHASLADAALAQGLWVRASEEHHQAASAFLGCIDGTNDENTKRTLRLLHDEHTKKANELDRKVARLIEEGKDPSVPQVPMSTTTQSSPLASKSDSAFRDATGPIEESFMLLGQKNELNSSFAHFWKILEGMLDHLSQPVAFATAPLHSPKHDRPPPVHEIHEPIEYPPPPSSSKLVNLSSPTACGREDEALDDMDDSWEVGSDESFQMIGAEKTMINSVTGRSPLKDENEELWRQLKQAQSRISDLEKLLKERMAHEHQLRDSIMQAQRAISSSQMLQSITKVPGLDNRQFPTTASPLRNLQILDPHHRQGPLSSLRQADSNGSESPSSLRSRINELEEKVRLLQVQDITQKAAIAKYKERWDKVKDSMKRKKLAKAAAEVQLAAERNRIDEEVEPE